MKKKVFESAKEPIPVPRVNKKKEQFLRSVNRYDTDKEIDKELEFLEYQKEVEMERLRWSLMSTVI